MQEGFDTILELTTRYINTAQINQEELEWYKRLFNCLQYFIEVFIPSGNTAGIKNAKCSLEKWIEERNFKRINQLHSIINSAESYLYFYEPKQLIVIDKNLHAIIGVNYLDPLNNNDVEELSIKLKELSDTEIDWFTFVYTQNGRAIGAFRCHRNYFERIKRCVENNEEFDLGVYGNPSPIELDKVPLEVLEDIFFEPFESQHETDAFVKMMYDIWRLQQYRTYLKCQWKHEQQLLEKKETLLTSNIKTYLQVLSVTMSEEKYKPLQQFITDFVENRKEIPQEEILLKLTAWSEELNKQLLSVELKK